MPNSIVIAGGDAMSVKDNRIGRKLVDYHSAITAPANLTGLWRFDMPSLLTIASGKVSALASWKSGSGSLVQPTGARQVPAQFDSFLGRNVGVFPVTALGSGCNYLPSGFSFDSNNQFTMLATVRVDAVYQFSAIWGNMGFLPAACCLSMRVNPNRFAFYYDDGIAECEPLNLGRWYRVICSYPGVGNIFNLRVGGRNAYVRIAAATAEPGVTDYGFALSNSYFTFAGAIDVVGLWTADLLLGGNAAQLATLDDWLDTRGV